MTVCDECGTGERYRGTIKCRRCYEAVFARYRESGMKGKNSAHVQHARALTVAVLELGSLPVARAGDVVNLADDELTKAIEYATGQPQWVRLEDDTLLPGDKVPKSIPEPVRARMVARVVRDAGPILSTEVGPLVGVPATSNILTRAVRAAIEAGWVVSETRLRVRTLRPGPVSPTS